MRFLKTFIVTSVLLVPGFALAQAGGINLSYLGNYSNGVVDLINTMLVPALMAIALLVFFWGVYKYFIYGAANEESRSEGRQFVIWSIIGFVVILSLWGLVNIVGSTLGLYPGGSSPPPPTIGGTSGGTISPIYGSPLNTVTPNSQTFSAPFTVPPNSVQTVPGSGYPAGSPAAQCFDTCSGSCTANSDGSYTCNPASGGTITPTPVNTSNYGGF